MNTVITIFAIIISVLYVLALIFIILKAIAMTRDPKRTDTLFEIWFGHGLFVFICAAVLFLVWI